LHCWPVWRSRFDWSVGRREWLLGLLEGGWIAGFHFWVRYLSTPTATMVEDRHNKQTAQDAKTPPLPSRPPLPRPPTTPRYSLFPGVSSNPGNWTRAERSGKPESCGVGLGQARSMASLRGKAQEEVTPRSRQGVMRYGLAIDEDKDDGEDAFIRPVKEKENENLAEEITMLLSGQSLPPARTPASPHVASPQSRRYGYAEPDAPGVMVEKKETRFHLTHRDVRMSVSPRTPYRKMLPKFASVDDLAGKQKDTAEETPRGICGAAAMSIPRASFTPTLDDPYLVPNGGLIPMGVAPFNLPSLRSLLRRSTPPGKTSRGILRETRIEVHVEKGENKESFMDRKDLLRSAPVREDHTRQFNTALEAGKSNILGSFNKDTNSPGAATDRGQRTFRKRRK
ncbi:hypothetical protein B0J11DRAFT_589014, partial [Dendryphion nanum]